MAERVLRVSILGDSRDLEKAFKTSSRSAKQFGADMSKSQAVVSRSRAGLLSFGKSVTAAGAGFLSAQGLLAGLQTSIDAASNLNEQTAKAKQVFGQSSAAIEAWAKTSADSFGIANDQALAAAGTFGNLFATVEIGPKVAADMSRALVELAADLASFNNASPEDALDALRSGLIGEAEPLRRFGVLLSEARVQQEAMRATGKRTAKSLTDQEKAFARYRIILQDTVTAQGDFNRTSEGFANQSRILKANLRDVAAAGGNLLIPVLTEATSGMLELIDAGGQAVDVLQRIKRELPLPDIVPGDAGPKFRRWMLYLAPGYGQLLALKDGADAAAGAIRGFRGEVEKPLKFDFSALNALTDGLMTAGLAAKDAIELRGLGTPPQIPGGTTEQRNNWFDAMIGRELDKVQDVRTLQGQVQALERIADLVRQRIAVTKDITRQLTLEDELRSITRQQRAIREQIAGNKNAARELALDEERRRIEEAKQKAQEAAAAAAEAAARAAQRRATRQFRALGLGPGGAELIPNAESLRKRLGSVTQSVKGTILDTSATRGLLARIRRVLVGGGFGKIADDVRATIDGMLDDITDSLKEFGDDNGELIKGRKANANSLLQGLGLDPAEIKALRGRLSQVGVGGTVPTRTLAAFGMPAGGSQINWSINLDGQPLEANVTRRQGTRKRRNPPQKRGTAVR